MTDPVTDWQAATARLEEIREQSKKMACLPPSEIMELFMSAREIVTFCVAAFKRQEPMPVDFYPHETYRYARAYARTLANTLLMHLTVSPRELQVLAEWLSKEPHLPRLRIVYT